MADPFEPAQWQWEPVHGTSEWQDCNIHVQSTLNSLAEQMGHGGSHKKLMHIGDPSGDLYHFDLHNLTQENTRTGDVKRLRRLSKAKDVPSLAGAMSVPGADGSPAAANSERPAWYQEERARERVRVRKIELKLCEEGLRELGGPEGSPQAFETLCAQRDDLLKRLEDLTGTPPSEFTEFNLEDPADRAILGMTAAEVPKDRSRGNSISKFFSRSRTSSRPSSEPVDELRESTSSTPPPHELSSSPAGSGVFSPVDLAALADAKFDEEMYVCRNYDKIEFSSNYDAAACMCCSVKRPKRVCQACGNACCDNCSKERHPRHPTLRICSRCYIRNLHRPQVKVAPRDQPVAVKVGFMKKRGQVNRSFAKRMFLLDSNGNLVYYNVQSKRFKEAGLIPLQAVQRYIGSRDKKDGGTEGMEGPLEFCLVTSTRTYVLSVETEDHMLTWKRLLLFGGELCWACGYKCVPSADVTGEQYVVIPELTRVYHRECFKCSECDAEISASADQDALIGDIPESLTSSTSSTSSGSMSTFEVSFNMEAGPNNRVSRGCAKIVCGDHVGPEAEHASASVCTHVNLGDHVNRSMIAESSYFVRKQATLRQLYGIEEFEDDEEFEGESEPATAEIDKAKSPSGGSALSRLLTCGLQGVISSTGDFSPFSEGCSAGFGALTSDDIGHLAHDEKLSRTLLANIKEADVKTADREDHAEVVFEAVRKAKFVLNELDRARRYRVEHEALKKEAGDMAGAEFDFFAFAPDMFNQIRKISCIPARDYMNAFSAMPEGSLAGGASGAWVKPTHDKKFILKSLPDVERKTLLELLPAYVEHLKSQPCTLLCRFVGLYEVRHRKHGRLSFVVMENILGKAGELQIHELYDLKGSNVSRRTHTRKNTISERASASAVGKLVTQKDMDLSRPLVVGERAKMILNMQITNDISFLNENKLMDYSLLVGIHNCSMMCEQCTPERRKNEVDTDGKVREAQIRSHGVRGAGPPANPECPQSVYFFGIIDLLQKWTSKKKLERSVKVKFLGRDSHGISAVNPDEYAVRFQEMLTERLEGGELPQVPTPGGSGGEPESLRFPSQLRIACPCRNYFNFDIKLFAHEVS